MGHLVTIAAVTIQHAEKRVFWRPQVHLVDDVVILIDLPVGPDSSGPALDSEIEHQLALALSYAAGHVYILVQFCRFSLQIY